MSAVNFDAPAILEKTIVGQIGPGQYRATHAVQVDFGSLTACLMQFSQKPKSQRPLYKIITNETARIGKCTLDYLDIEQLALQPNYPLPSH